MIIKTIKILIKVLMVSLLLSTTLFVIKTMATPPTEIKINNEKIISVNRWDICLTTEEIELLGRIVQLECGYDIQESKFATIETIFNRISDPKYPNTLEEVLSQSGQFSTWKNRTITQATPTDDTYMCINMVLNGQTNILEMDSMKFNNKPIGKSSKKIGAQYYGK